MVLPDLHLLVHDVSDLLLCSCFILCDAALVRVDSSSQRLLCVHTASLERDPESAAGLWLYIKAGWGHRVGCRMQDLRLCGAAETQLPPQRERLPGYRS